MMIPNLRLFEFFLEEGCLSKGARFDLNKNLGGIVFTKSSREFQCYQTNMLFDVKHSDVALFQVCLIFDFILMRDQ